MTDKVLTIVAISLIAVVMVLGSVAPVMAGNHATVPPEDPPCESLENPSDDKSGGNSDKGKGKAKEIVCP